MKENYYNVLYKAEINHWWYRGRRKFIHYLIGKYKNSSHNLKVLDVGCGTGALLGELAYYCDVFGLDFSDKAVSFCRERGIANVTKGLVQSIPFNDCSFDFVLAMDVIEHIKDDDKAIRELYRVLKPGGVVIIFVPAFMFLWGVTDVVSQHFRRYTKREIQKKITKENFSIVRGTYFNTLLFTPILLVRWFTKLLPIQYRPSHEVGMKNGIMNKVFDIIFNLEIKLLNFINFPFGVSVAIIAKKQL